MLIDSHCHLNRLQSVQDDTGQIDHACLDQYLQQARASGVSGFLNIAVDLDDHAALCQISARHPDVVMSVGVHPCEDQQMLARATVETLCQLGAAGQVWAIGETGLDYHYSTELRLAQQASFERHIEAARQLDKPLIVHTRDARQDTIAILRQAQAGRGVLHCFTEDWATARAALDMGWFISFSGIITFKNAESLRDVVRQVPLDRLLIETDSPYLAPVPFRGKSNQPAYLPQVAACVAALHGVSTGALAHQLWLNFQCWSGRQWPAPHLPLASTDTALPVADAKAVMAG